MGSRQLAKLEKLSERQQQKSRHRLDQQQAEFDQLTRQCDELKVINREYQRESANDDVVTPAMLAHRRNFVTRLTEQIDHLDLQRQKKQNLLKQTIQDHLMKSSRHAAVSAIKENLLSEEALSMSRREQRLSDESYQASRASNDAQMKGDGHE